MSDVMTIERDLGRRSVGEELFIWRQRLRAPERRGLVSQAEAAERLGVDGHLYWLSENDRAPVRDAQAVLDTVRELTGQIEPTTGELCRIARRRSGLRLVDVTNELGISVPQYLGDENEAAQRVRELWTERGFIFP